MGRKKACCTGYIVTLKYLCVAAVCVCVSSRYNEGRGGASASDERAVSSDVAGTRQKTGR